MRSNEEVIAAAKKFYIEKSMELQGQYEFKKTLQSLALIVIYLENNKEDKHLFRNARNMLYDMNKDIKNKIGKNIMKSMLKIIYF